MFGFSWAEIALIMAVALIAIGPKDLPVAIRTVTTLMKKARGMAAEFQGHVDEMMREANLADVKTEINKLRRFDFKGAVESTVDPDGTLRAATQSPFAEKMGAKTVFSSPATPAVAQPGAAAPVTVAEEAMEARAAEAPAFIPPDAARRAPMPDFIPPNTRRWGR